MATSLNASVKGLVITGPYIISYVIQGGGVGSNIQKLTDMIFFFNLGNFVGHLDHQSV